MLSLVTDHGRAAPLMWLSVWKDEIATRRNDYEDACLRRLAELVPQGCQVTTLADRGFGDQKLFGFLGEFGFGSVTSSASAATFMSPPRMTGRDQRPNGWARVAGHASCVMPGDGEGAADRGRRVRPRERHEGAVTRSARASSGGSLRDGAWPQATRRLRRQRWSTTTPAAGRLSRKRPSRTAVLARAD